MPWKIFEIDSETAQRITTIMNLLMTYFLFLILSIGIIIKLKS